MTVVVVAGDLQGFPACRTQHVAAKVLARLASVLQPGSKLSCGASTAAQQATSSHTISSVSSLSTTSSAQLPSLHTLSTNHILTQTAARAQGTGSYAISASPFFPSPCGTTNQAAWSQAVPKGWHQQHATGMASSLSEF